MEKDRAEATLGALADKGVEDPEPSGVTGMEGSLKLQLVV